MFYNNHVVLTQYYQVQYKVGQHAIYQNQLI